MVEVEHSFCCTYVHVIILDTICCLFQLEMVNMDDVADEAVVFFVIGRVINGVDD